MYALIIGAFASIIAIIAMIVYIMQHSYINDSVMVNNIKYDVGCVIINDAIRFSDCIVSGGDHIIYSNNKWMGMVSYLRKLWIKYGLLCCVLAVEFITQIIASTQYIINGWVIAGYIILSIVKLAALVFVASCELIYNNCMDVDYTRCVENITKYVKMDNGCVMYERGDGGKTMYADLHYMCETSAEIYDIYALKLRKLLCIGLMSFGTASLIYTCIIAERYAEMILNRY